MPHRKDVIRREGEILEWVRWSDEEYPQKWDVSGHVRADNQGDGQMVADFTKRMEMAIISSREVGA